MARKALPRPTDGELEILQVLWASSGRSIREICDALEVSTGERPGATSIGNRVDIMIRKGMVRRDDTRAPILFYATASEAPTKRLVLRDLLDRLFGGSTKNMVMHALKTKTTSPEELTELMERLKDMRREK